jgi:DNA-directed RNA polymerase subunit RPC12/RpoP
MKKPKKPAKTQYFCPKCGREWIEIDPTIVKVWCSRCNLIMKKVIPQQSNPTKSKTGWGMSYGFK